MAINLQKGQTINIEPVWYNGSVLNVGISWEIKKSFKEKQSFLSSLFGSRSNNHLIDDYAIDASCFLLANTAKLLSDKCLVFYNNTVSADESVSNLGDSINNGDDETLIVDLMRVDSKVEEILFAITIYDGRNRKQNFGQLHLYVRIYDALTNSEIAKYELDEDCSVETAVEFGRLYRRAGTWKFEAIGRGYAGGLQALVDTYYQP